MTDPLARFIPKLLKAELATPAGRPHDDARSVEVAVLWLDIHGFTPLTRRFADEGSRGAEIVGEILDRTYGALIDQIDVAGGDVVDFAGDGVLVVWAADESRLADAVLRATQTAIAIQQTMDRFEAAAGAEIRFYAGIGAGQVSLLDVGGVDGHWRFLVAGTPLQQMAQAKQCCEAGEVLLSPEAHSQIASSVGGEQRQNSTFAVTRVDHARSERAGSADPIGDLDPERIRPYLLGSVLRRIDAGQTGWLAEFRLASIVFIIVPEIHAHDADGRRFLQESVARAQDRIAGLGGSLNQVMMDDTGLVMLAAWGVPDHTHEDDARRAMKAAIEIRSALESAGLGVRAGVGTGRIFCGAVGNATRSRFALVGDAVNRAARIAMASTTTVRCDELTRDGAARWLAFEADDTLLLKGLDEAVSVYTVSDRALSSAPGAPEQTQLSGREEERRILEEALGRSASIAGQPLLLIEGEAGIGKSVLLQHLSAAAADADHDVLWAVADAVEVSTAYFPWRELFRTLFKIDPTLPPESERERVATQVRSLTEHVDRVPLIEPVLGLGFAENDTTAAMAGVDRGIAARELLSEIFDALAGPSPVILLEDLHWFDSASLELIGAIRSRTPRALVGAATRPPAEDALPQLLELAGAPGTIRIPLVEMSGSEVLAMVKSGLGVDDLPEELAELLVKRGEGHPLFTIELALLLRELGVVKTDGRQCAFNPTDERLAALRFPEKAEGVVATRIDRLDPAHQLALKVAAVIGRSFEHRVVRDIYPIEGKRSGVRQILDELTHPKLIEEEQPDPALAYLFRHVVIREVAYELVSYAQRRQLHAEVAQVLELAEDSDINANLPLLAHHWQMAEEPGRAIDYLQRAGEQALHRGAGREALRFFQSAFAIAEREEGRIDEANSIRLAELERLTGASLEQLLDLPESTRWLTGALNRLGYTVRETGSPQRRSDLIKQAFVQLGHILWPVARRRRPSGSELAQLELAALAYGTLAEHCYFESDMLGMILLSLTSVNLAERAQSVAAAERPFITLAHTVGLMGMQRLARRYRRHSENAALGRNQSFREIEYGARNLVVGRMDQASAAGVRAAALAKRYGDSHHEAQGWGLVASAELRRGNIERGCEAAERMLPTGHVEWGLIALAISEALSDRPAGAIARVAEMDAFEPAFRLGHLTMKMLNAEQMGDLERADRHAHAALAEVETPGIKNAFTAGHYASLMAFYSRRYHGLLQSDTQGRETVIANIQRLHRELRRFCRLFPIGRPRLQHAAGLLALHAGRTRRGIQHLERGLRLAIELGMQPEVVALNIERVRWKLPGAEAAAAEALEVCHDLGLDRLRAELDDAIA